LTELQTVSPEEQLAMVAHQAKKHLIDFSIATDSSYQDTWFHEALATVLMDAMEKVEKNIDVRIIIEAPPRHGKTEISSKKFAAWALGHHPDWPIIVGSYSTELAVKFGEGTRSIMDSPRYKAIFNTRLSKDTKAKGYWKTDKGGSYMAAGAGGSFTGSGYKIGLIDDIFKDRKEADSKVIRDSRWDWYRSTFYTRQEGASAIIVINTRWHTDDLVGRLLAQQEKDEQDGVENFDKWQRITFPAIAIKDESFRSKGEALWPDKFPIGKLKKTENTLGPYEFAALYQASPITSSNQEFKQSWIKYISWSEVELLNTRKFATIDPGGKNQDNDYTGVVRNYVDARNNWYIKAMGVHFNSVEIINLLFVLHDEGFEVIGIEETVFLNAIKPFFDEECRKRNKFPNVVPLKHAGRNKETRIRGVIPRYASGSIFHIVGECKDLEDQMAVFPKGANDDVLDSLAYENDIAEAPLDDVARIMMRRDRDERRSQVKSKYGL
jgi:hypothetical protein